MRDSDRLVPGTMEAERLPDGSYAVAPEPTLWQDLGWAGVLSVSVSAIGLAWLFISLALWLVGD